MCILPLLEEILNISFLWVLAVKHLSLVFSLLFDSESLIAIDGDYFLGYLSFYGLLADAQYLPLWGQFESSITVGKLWRRDC